MFETIQKRGYTGTAGRCASSWSCTSKQRRSPATRSLSLRKFSTFLYSSLLFSTFLYIIPPRTPYIDARRLRRQSFGAPRDSPLSLLFSTFLYSSLLFSTLFAPYRYIDGLR